LRDAHDGLNPATKLQRAITRSSGAKRSEPRQADPDAEQARELEQLIASGAAANKLPPR
jgi:hypothetical protein